MTNILEQITPLKEQFKDKILRSPSFTNNPPKDTNLYDIVFLYNDGRFWKIVPLNVAINHPIIHDTYHEVTYTTDKTKNVHNIPKIKSTKTVEKPISVVICPFTLLSQIYFGEYESFDHVYNNNLIIHDKEKIIIPIINKIYSSKSNIEVQYIQRKAEVRIMTLENAIKEFPDCQFINISDKLETDNLGQITNNKILYPINEYCLDHPPKTITYIIEYKSLKKDGYKYTVIIPKMNDGKSNYNIVKNGFNAYFNKSIDKIREKNGMIYPCLWFAWSATHSEYKTIKL